MISGVTADSYTNAAVIANEKYKTVPTVLKGGLSAGSTGSAAVDPRSVVLATTGNSRAYSPRSLF